MANAIYRRYNTLDVKTGGTAALTGTIQVNSVNAERNVLLIEQESMKVRRMTRSNSLGQYTFARLKAGIVWLILCIDEQGLYNAGVKSHEST